MLTPNHHLNSKHRNIMAILNRVGDRVLELIFIDAKIRRPLPGGPPFPLSPNPLPSTPKLHGTFSNSFQEFASRHPPTHRVTSGVLESIQQPKVVHRGCGCPPQGGGGRSYTEFFAILRMSQSIPSFSKQNRSTP